MKFSISSLFGNKNSDSTEFDTGLMDDEMPMEFDGYGDYDTESGMNGSYGAVPAEWVQDGNWGDLPEMQEFDFSAPGHSYPENRNISGSSATRFPSGRQNSRENSLQSIPIGPYMENDRPMENNRPKTDSNIPKTDGNMEVLPNDLTLRPVSQVPASGMQSPAPLSLPGIGSAFEDDGLPSEYVPPTR